MASRNLLRLSLLFAASVTMGAALSAQSPTFGVGRAPTPDEIKAWDIAIRPDGAELPPGRGVAKDGATLFTQKGCAGCHGRTGSGSMAPTLIKSDGTNKNAPPCLAPCVNDSNVMALHAPYATVVWDYINRAMPINKEGTLKPDEVYSLTAYILFKNGVIKEDDVMDQQSLPKVVMPNLKGYALPREPWKHGAPRLLNYP